MKELDTSKDGEIDEDEWCVFRVRKIRVASTAWTPSLRPLTGLCTAQGGCDLPRAREAHGGPEGRAGAARQGGGRGRRGVLGRVLVCG